MFLTIEYSKIPKDCILIDVRSPSEYKNATIEGAINIPIFDDEERALVGTTYKQVSVEDAKRQGIEIASKKLLSIYDQVSALKKGNHKKVVVFCARGGYRSHSVAMFLNSIGTSIYLLKGGYRAYRKEILSQMEEMNKEVTYVVLHGNTGIGKTRILKKLRDYDLDVLDFEEGANHRGSLLGGVGKGDEVSTKQFESYIYHRLKERKTDYVFVEAESRRIGKVFIPQYIHDHMKSGLHIHLTADIDFRTQVILEDYMLDEHFDQEFLASLERLKKYMKPNQIQAYLDALEKKDYAFIASDMMLNYYDPLYEHTTNQYDFDTAFHVEGIDEVSENINQWFSEHYGVNDEDETASEIELNA